MARIADIRVGERLWEDMGDLAGLAESLKKYGLLHPIIVDEELNLIAGQRRLEAAKLLGWADIDVKYKTDLAAKEKRALELEENLKRKDLTSYERNKTITEIVKVAKEVAQSEGVRSPNTQREPGSRRDIEERTGIPVSTQVEAEQHVATADAYPFMQKPDWKQYYVLEAREAIEKIPEEDRPTVAAMLNEPAVPPRLAIGLMKNIADMKPTERQEVCRLYQSDDPRNRSLAKTCL